MTDDILATLLDLESQGWDALCREGRGGPFYRDLMTEDAVMVLADGSLLDREAVAASLEHAPPWATYRIDDPRLLRLGPDAAGLVYRGTASRGAGGPDFVAAMSSVYRRVEQEWRLVLYQQTVVPTDAP